MVVSLSRSSKLRLVKQWPWQASYHHILTHSQSEDVPWALWGKYVFTLMSVDWVHSQPWLEKLSLQWTAGNAGSQLLEVLRIHGCPCSAPSGTSVPTPPHDLLHNRQRDAGRDPSEIRGWTSILHCVYAENDKEQSFKRKQYIEHTNISFPEKEITELLETKILNLSFSKKKKKELSKDCHL